MVAGTVPQAGLGHWRQERLAAANRRHPRKFSELPHSTSLLPSMAPPRTRVAWPHRGHEIGHSRVAISPAYQVPVTASSDTPRFHVVQHGGKPSQTLLCEYRWVSAILNASMIVLSSEGIFLCIRRLRAHPDQFPHTATGHADRRSKVASHARPAAFQ